MAKNIPTEIDIVIAWVDGSDPQWRKIKNQYANPTASGDGKAGKDADTNNNTKNDAVVDCSGKDSDARDNRFRDWEMLPFLFRGIEENLPWVRKIHFVTFGHLPKWLNTAHPKLHIVNHEDYIPKEYRPTFNSHTIEWNFHRIEGLAEHFIYLNDDMFFLRPMKPEDFFRDGKPVDMLALQPDVANTENTVMPYIYLNNVMVLAKYFKKYENVKKQPGAYFHLGYPLMHFCYNFLEMAFPRFTGFYTVHGPSPLRKSTYETLWSLEPELLTEVCSHRFRSKEDISQYVLREWQKLSGDFIPKNITANFRYYTLSNDNAALTATIRQKKASVLCINDSDEDLDFTTVRDTINEAFTQAFPKKSSFEL